jgi:hypothetical protein
MYATPRKQVVSPRRGAAIDDHVIQEFVRVMDETPADQWTKRTNAFSTLLSHIPHDIYVDDQWFSNPKTLRHLSSPISSLLKDSRSTVVKRTCENCAELFEKCGTTARYLLKDLMSAIMAVHAQTVQVIRTYVQNMVCDALPKVPCKAVMPVWLDRLKSDKSRTVREACAIYLTVALDSWKDEESYLTRDIWTQVGSCMIRSLRDPSPSVRDYAKQGLDVVRVTQPDLWEQLIRDPEGIATKDPKLKRFLLKMGSEDDDDLSVASRGSTASLASNRSRRAPPTRPRAPPRGLGLGPPLRINTAAVKQSPAKNRVRSSQSPLHQNGGRKLLPESPGESPFVAGVSELKRQASVTRSRRSSIMKDRWSRSSSNILPLLGDEQESVIQKEPEHQEIARKLLGAHKKSVDGMMETIRLEMDTLEDFESSEKTEEAVLTYFEALGLCLDRRAKLGKVLQTVMDDVSAGKEES